MHWKRHTPSSAAATHYAREFDISSLTAQVLLNRGINGLDAMRAMLRPSLDRLHDPFTMRNMDRAVRRLRRAIARKERIQIHGDYDVDGITSTAVLLIGLRALGADVGYHIINRRDASVGLSVRSLERDHLPSRPSVIVTADCGTTSNAAIQAAQEQGVDVIVVDHHLPGPELPACAALLNPIQPRCDFPFKQLAAVGVAFNLVLALDRFIGSEDATWPRVDLHGLLDLVALGTVSDLVPLVDENRAFVHEGLRLIRAARRPGVCAILGSAQLISQQGSSGLSDPINVRTIGFRIAPLLNAAGRMDDANKCVELLTTTSYRVADGIARELVATNAERQTRERSVLSEASAAAAALVERGAGAIVLADPSWHPGVLGIVASRLVEQFNLPALVASVDESGMAKGSVRSPDGVDMLEALRHCRDLLETYGGHRVAAGVAFPFVHLDDLRRRLAVSVLAQLPEGGVAERSIEIDAEVQLEALDERFVSELEQLAPFGMGNPEPVFETDALQVVHAKTVGARNVRVRLRAGGTTVSAFGFGFADRVGEFRGTIRAAFHPRIVRDGKRTEVELLLRDFVSVAE